MQKPLACFGSKKIFYGWFILGGAFIILFFNAICYAILGIAMKPITVDMGWSPASMSTTVFIYMVVHSISVPLGGKIYDRFGPRAAIILLSLFILVGNIMVAFTQSYLLFNIAFGVFVGIGMGGPGSPLMAAIICKWFTRYRGLAISLAIAGFCLGLFVLIPLTSYFVEHIGWRQAFLTVGIVLFVVNTIMALIIIKGDPKDFGLLPLGAEETGAKTVKAFDPAHDLSMSNALRTSGFWYMLAVMTVCGVGCTYITMYFINVAVDYNIEMQSASNILGLTGIYSIIGMLVAGPLADKLGGRWPLAIAMLLRVIGFAAVLYAQTLFAFNILSLMMGLTLMATLPISNTVAANMFGTSHIGFITGIFTTGHHGGGAILAVLVGFIFKATGHYNMVFIIILIICAVGVIAAMLIKEKRYYFENGKISQEN